MSGMNTNALSAAEEKLKAQFEGKAVKRSRVPSTARAITPAKRIDQLVLPLNERPAMPFTKDRFVIRENPQLVQWERELRKFLARLSSDHGHVIAAVMVYEWATGIKVKDLVAAGGSANSDLRHLNKLLREYFGASFTTWICGRKVPRAYRVKAGFYVRRRRPRTVTLYAEWAEGVLRP